MADLVSGNIGGPFDLDWFIPTAILLQAVPGGKDHCQFLLQSFYPNVFPAKHVVKTDQSSITMPPDASFLTDEGKENGTGVSCQNCRNSRNSESCHQRAHQRIHQRTSQRTRSRRND